MAMEERPLKRSTDKPQSERDNRPYWERIVQRVASLPTRVGGSPCKTPVISCINPSLYR